MISNSDEARILLKKWSSESSLVFALHTACTPSPNEEGFLLDAWLSMAGRIRAGSSDDIFGLLTDDSDYLLFSLRDCKVSFDFAGFTGMPEGPPPSVPEGWESMLVLVFKTGFWLALFAFPQGHDVERSEPAF